MIIQIIRIVQMRAIVFSIFLLVVIFIAIKKRLLKELIIGVLIFLGTEYILFSFLPGGVDIISGSHPAEYPSISVYSLREKRRRKRESNKNKVDFEYRIKDIEIELQKHFEMRYGQKIEKYEMSDIKEDNVGRGSTNYYLDIDIFLVGYPNLKIMGRVNNGNPTISDDFKEKIINYRVKKSLENMAIENNLDLSKIHIVIQYNKYEEAYKAYIYLLENTLVGYEILVSKTVEIVWEDIKDEKFYIDIKHLREKKDIEEVEQLRKIEELTQEKLNNFHYVHLDYYDYKDDFYNLLELEDNYIIKRIKLRKKYKDKRSVVLDRVRKVRDLETKRVDVFYDSEYSSDDLRVFEKLVRELNEKELIEINNKKHEIGLLCHIDEFELEFNKVLVADEIMKIIKEVEAEKLIIKKMNLVFENSRNSVEMKLDKREELALKLKILQHLEKLEKNKEL